MTSRNRTVVYGVEGGTPVDIGVQGTDGGRVRGLRWEENSVQVATERDDCKRKTCTRKQGIF